MELKLSKTHYSLKAVLVILFSLVLLAEAYLGYRYLYSNIFSETETFPEDNVVRVNLKAYESTMDYLEGLYSYQPDPLVLPRTNPFR